MPTPYDWMGVLFIFPIENCLDSTFDDKAMILKQLQPFSL